jgi:hypothetical protein
MSSTKKNIFPHKINVKYDKSYNHGSIFLLLNLRLKQSVNQ